MTSDIVSVMLHDKTVSLTKRMELKREDEGAVLVSFNGMVGLEPLARVSTT